MDIENFVTELLNDIKEAGLKNENFDLHLEAVYTTELAEAIANIKWIEIYQVTGLLAWNISQILNFRR